MIFFVLVLLLIVFHSSKAAKPGEFHQDYIARDKINSIKGIFVILILYSHGKGYIEIGGVYDDPYIAMQNHLNQMVVAMFLFYSGYGIMEQIKKREFAYIKSIPQKRFPNLLLNYDISIVLFLILGLAMGDDITVKKFLLALVAWEGIGNSSWYIFVTLSLYILTFISFFPLKWAKSKQFKLVSLIVLTALSVGLVYALMVIGKHRVWYNTLILYALGMWYSYFKDTIEKIVMKNDIIYSVIVMLLFGVYILAFRKRWDSIEIYTVWAVCFTLITVLFTMKISISSTVLDWFGKHIFSIYILQRLPMNFLSEKAFFQTHKYLFLIVSYLITIVLAQIFDYFTGKLSSAIWKNKKELKPAK